MEPLGRAPNGRVNHEGDVRWLFINPIGEQGWGGMEGWMLRLARVLRRLGDECHVVARAASPWAHKCEEHGLPFHPLPFGGEISPHTWMALRKIVRTVQPDAAVVKGFKQVRWLRLVSRWVATAVKLPGSQELSGGLVQWATLRWCVDRILTDCEATRRAFLRHPWLLPARIVTVPNGIDPGGPWPDPSRRQRARAQLMEDVPERDALLIASVGRLTPEKRWEDAVESLAQIAPRVKFCWVVLGDGPLRLRLERLAAARGLGRRVRWMGHREDARELLWGADLLLHSSEREGLSNVLLEAMAAGVPIVATDAGGTSEAVMDRKTGWIVPVGAVHDMARALEHLAANPELRHSMGAAGAKLVRERFTLDAMARQIRAAMDDVVGHRTLRRQLPTPLGEGWQGIVTPATDRSHLIQFLRGDRTGWNQVKQTPRTEVWRWPSPNTDVFAKLYRPTRLPERLGAFFRPPRARSNLRTATLLELLGADVVPHWAAAWRGTESVLLTAAVPNSIALDEPGWLSELAPRQRRQLAKTLGIWLARLHAAWIAPHDLKTSNILRTPDGRLWLLDLDNCVTWRPPRLREVGRNLFQIARSFEQMGGRREWLVFLAAYTHTRGWRKRQLQRVLRDVDRRWHRRGSNPCGPLDPYRPPHSPR